jgi:hypothetical protein
MGAATGNLTGSAIGAAGAPLVASTGATLAAKAFTSPKMIDWMVKQTKVPFGLLTQQLALLAKHSQKWPEQDREVAQSLSLEPREYRLGPDPHGPGRGGRDRPALRLGAATERGPQLVVRRIGREIEDFLALDAIEAVHR